jgi:predicted Zn-dependent protease
VSWLARSILVLLTSVSSGASASELMDDTNRAWQLWGQQHHQEAIALLQQVIARDKTFYRAYTLVADIFADQGRLKEEELYFRSLILPGKKNPLAFYGLAKIFLAKNDPERAASLYADCIRSSSRELVCYEEISIALRACRRLSRDELVKLIQFDTTNPYVYLPLSSVYGAQTKPMQEQAALRKGLALAGTDYPELRARLEYVLGGSYQATHQDFNEGLAHREASLRFYESINDWPNKTEEASEIADYWVLRDPGRHLRNIFQF